MTNRERLEDAGILEKDQALKPDEEKAIEDLTAAELDYLFSVKKKVKEELHLELLISPPTHHH
jgi:hypothetical protein